MNQLIWHDRSNEDIDCCFRDDSAGVAIEALTVFVDHAGHEINEGRGDRRAFARRDVTAGEVLARNAPLAFVAHHNDKRCGACFAQTKLRRCGKCQQVWYCSRTCQVEDFPLHRVECREATALFVAGGEDRREGQRNARLLIRTYLELVRKQQASIKQDEEDDPYNSCRLVPSPNSHSSGTTNADSAVCACSSRHFQQLQPSATAMLDPDERQSLQLALEVLQRQETMLHTKMGVEIGSTAASLLLLKQQLESMLRRFRVNNFGMVDDMLHLVGGGVYPLAALLNHSCAPNCLLRYMQGGIVEIVAARNITEGEELTHSYVELVAPTQTRQERLKEIYGFTCDCPRCQQSGDDSSSQISLPINYLELPFNDLVEYILDHYNPTTGDEKTKAAIPAAQVRVSIEDLLQPLSSSSEKNRQMIQQVSMLQQQANLAMSNDDLEQELNLLSEAIRLLEMSETDDDDSSNKNIPYFSLQLYQVRCQRLSSWIVAEQPEKALEDCRHIVAVLCVALKTTPNHPLLGLQLFTLGDLYEACGQTERATTVHRWARSTLAISQGPTSEMVKLLDKKLR
jgi:SET and MYND domain-containing protein